MKLSEVPGLGETTFVSLSAKPGKFGETVHTAAFQHLGMPWTYHACLCTDIASDVALMRSYGVPAAAVSMPHKQAVMEHLDEITPGAAEIGAVNTIMNREGLLVGYNTDIRGVQHALAGTTSQDVFVLLGKGGMAATFQAAIKGAIVHYGRAQIGIPHRLATVVINATPMGMEGVPSHPGLLDGFPKCRRYIESVVGTTPTQTDAAQRGIEVVSGVDITFHQAMAQCELFTGRPAPEAIMREAWRLVTE